MERAMAMETASGSPSGIATIKITTAVMNTLPTLRIVALEKIDKLSLKQIKSNENKRLVTKMRNVAKKACFLIALANRSSFCSKSVCYSFKTRSSGLLILDKRVFLPTLHTIALPCPVIIFESDNKKGSGCCLWLSTSTLRPLSIPKYTDYSF